MTVEEQIAELRQKIDNLEASQRINANLTGLTMRQLLSQVEKHVALAELVKKMAEAMRASDDD